LKALEAKLKRHRAEADEMAVVRGVLDAQKATFKSSSVRMETLNAEIQKLDTEISMVRKQLDEQVTGVLTGLQAKEAFLRETGPVRDSLNRLDCKVFCFADDCYQGKKSKPSVEPAKQESGVAHAEECAETQYTALYELLRNMLE